MNEKEKKMLDDKAKLFYENISNLLKENILAPILETIIDSCKNSELTMKLIEEAKGGQLGKRRLEELACRYDSELLEALNQISRLYENPVKVVKGVFGDNTPDATSLRSISDEIINSFVKLYFPDMGQRDAERRHHMSLIRSKLLAYIKGNNLHDSIEEIMRLKQQAGIINTGFTDGYGEGLNLSNLDLSGIDFRTRGFKQVSFDNSNLSNAKFNHVPRCTFNNCNLEGADFTNADLIGEEVSFTKANIRHAKFIGTKLEKGTTWRVCETPSELKNELIRKGAKHVNTAFYTKEEYLSHKRASAQHLYESNASEGVRSRRNNI